MVLARQVTVVAGATVRVPPPLHVVLVRLRAALAVLKL
jgi:hypothetical protein